MEHRGLRAPALSYKRRDIQGLRAVAVLLVFANHAVDRPPGGFIGVDVFFVISGFLITGMLMREYEATNTISLRRFVAARVRRILPSAALVLAATVVLAWGLFSHARAASTTADAVWAFLLSANWHTALTGVDYFAQSATVSPLQHYWSLAVEEQFYLVWPWAVLLALALSARRRPDRRRLVRPVVGGVVVLVSLTSFAWALQQTPTEPSVAYFSTFTRAWELALGGGVAVAAPLFAALRPLARTVLAYAGLSGIAASALLITPDTSWPAPWALAPTLATAAVIAAGTGRTAPGSAPLTNGVAVFVGDISYSLYLWHFPVIVFGHALFPGDKVLALVIIVAASFALATAQYFALERPLWTSPWGRPHAPGGWTRWRHDNRRPVRAGAALGALTIVAVAALSIALPPRPPVVVDAATTAPDVAGVPLGPEGLAANERVRESLASTFWPRGLSPEIDRLGLSSTATAWSKSGCLNAAAGALGESVQAVTDRCLLGDADAPRLAVLVGDSVAISWAAAVQSALGPDYRLLVLTMGQCPFAFVDVRQAHDAPFPECSDFHSFTASLVAQLSPDLTVLSEEDASSAHAGTADFEEGLRASIGHYASVSSRVAVITAPPERDRLWWCYSAVGSPADCIDPVSPAHEHVTQALTKAASPYRDVTVYATDAFFCAGGFCPAYAGSTVTYVDRIHLTQEGGALLGPALREAMESGGSLEASTDRGE